MQVTPAHIKSSSLFPDGNRGAEFSPCGRYRYALWRLWKEGENLNVVAFLMLNPSAADGYKDDPTIRRCIGFAKAWGYDGLWVANLFAYQATNPKALLHASNPIGPDNPFWIERISAFCHITVCAWGNGGIVNKLMKRHPKYLPLTGTRHLHYLEQSNSGHPKHPLYLPGHLEPQRYVHPGRFNPLTVPI